jgi:hypothetical protein
MHLPHPCILSPEWRTVGTSPHRWAENSPADSGRHQMMLSEPCVWSGDAGSTGNSDLTYVVLRSTHRHPYWKSSDHAGTWVWVFGLDSHNLQMPLALSTQGLGELWLGQGTTPEASRLPPAAGNVTAPGLHPQVCTNFNPTKNSILQLPASTSIY